MCCNYFKQLNYSTADVSYSTAEDVIKGNLDVLEEDYPRYVKGKEEREGS
jgi:hypothetical protein